MCAPRGFASSRRARSSGSPAATSTRNCRSSAATACGSGRSRATGRIGDFWTGSAGLDVIWELDFWGKFRRGIEAADAEYLASIAEYDDLQVLVAAEAASFYASIRTFELRLRIAHENAALQKRSLEITERLFRSGNESELDLQQARTLYLSTLATIPELEASLYQTQNALAILLGTTAGPAAGDGRRARAHPRRRPRNHRRAAGRPAAPAAGRAHGRAAAGRAVGPHRGEQGGVSIRPSCSAARSSSRRPPLMGSSYALDWAVGPAIVWNFDYNRLTNQVLVQDARFQQLFEQYQDTVLRAARELEDAAIGFAQRRAQVAILEESVQAARRSLDIADVQYREGLVDFQRVLDSQRALFSQQERLVTTQGGVAQSLIDLYKAMGGGWQPGRSMPIVDDADARRDGRAQPLEATARRSAPAADDSQPPP